jgi:hypothetical protein
MIDNKIKLKTLYVNRLSKQETYFFFKKNDILYGARKDPGSDWKWKFATWRSYHEIDKTDDIKKQDNKERIYRETIISLWD